jgi:hypothetical protein
MARGLPRTLARAAAREAGTHPPVAGLKAEITGGGGSLQDSLHVAGAGTDALAYASQKIFDFLDGKVRIKGGTAKQQFAVLGVRASTINDNAALTWALGSAAASSATLAGTMVNVMASTARTLDGAAAALSTASTGDMSLRPRSTAPPPPSTSSSISPGRHRHHHAPA